VPGWTGHYAVGFAFAALLVLAEGLEMGARRPLPLWRALMSRMYRTDHSLRPVEARFSMDRPAQYQSA
jgi:hypothetical protein